MPFNRVEYQEKLDNLWDRLSELAGGNLLNRLSKEEWKLAKEIFDLEEREKIICDGKDDAYSHHIDGKCIKDEPDTNDPSQFPAELSDTY